MLKKIILILIIISILFNYSILNFNKVYAEPFSIVIGGKILLFLLALAGIGVTLDTYDKTENEIKLSAETMVNEYEGIYGSIEGWHDILTSYLKYKTIDATYELQQFFNNLKDYIQSKNVIPGKNKIIGYNSYVQEYIDKFYMDNINKNVNYFKNGNQVLLIDFYPKEPMLVDKAYLRVTFPNGDILYKEYIGPYNYQTMTYWIDWNKYSSRKIVVSDGHLLSVIWDIPWNFQPINVSNQSVEVNVNDDSYVLTGIPPVYYEKPNIYPPGISTSWNPELARNVTTIPYTSAEYAQYLSESMTYDDYVEYVNGNTSIPYTIDDNTIPGISILEEEGITTIPYPNVNEGNIEDVSEFQGQNISILQRIANILYGISNLISDIPNIIANLFNPTISIDLSPLQSINVTEKWPFSIPIDIKNIFQSLQFEKEAPVWTFIIPATNFTNESTLTIDMSYFDNIVTIFRTLITILIVISLSVLTWKVFL